MVGHLDGLLQESHNSTAKFTGFISVLHDAHVKSL